MDGSRWLFKNNGNALGVEGYVYVFIESGNRYIINEMGCYE